MIDVVLSHEWLFLTLLTMLVVFQVVVKRLPPVSPLIIALKGFGFILSKFIKKVIRKK